ncbi:MAG: carbohydrate ABC transporter permease [Clostridiales bacterium]|nr:carbohydrate ABC transporter permease [Clostridiales bacterium]
MNPNIRGGMGSKLFDFFNYAFLGILALCCLLPIVHVLALSLSDAASAGGNLVTFWPKGFNVSAYRLVFGNPVFLNSFLISVARTALGCAISLLMTVLAAYPLSKDERELRGRNAIRWIFIVPMLINGGLVPGFILIRNLRLMNTIWALVLPGSVPIFYIIMMMNFFRGINKSILESAAMDGANEAVVLARIALPLSMASIATITLFTIVNHWNSWFDGLIFTTGREMWPLQTLLMQMMKSVDTTAFSSGDITLLNKLSDRSFRAAQIIFATVPILCVYPFMQRYFISGMTIGAVKE